jgi:hypothetical protein
LFGLSLETWTRENRKSAHASTVRRSPKPCPARHAGRLFESRVLEEKTKPLYISVKGTKYRALFRRRHTTPGLIQVPMVYAQLAPREFEIVAWNAAKAKARELGWIK